MADDRTDGFDINQRRALVCVDAADRQAPVTAALAELGYRVVAAATADEATERLRKETFEVLVVDEAFQGASPTDNAMLRSIQWMPMSTRRSMFVALLGGGVKTLDNMAAFARSVNAVVSYDDLAQVKPILERGITDNDQFYRVFREVLQDVGKR